VARTRGFDADAALEKAMRLFWRHGYEGTSIEVLTAELGIGKPSLYAAFGNKRALFERVLERYATAGRANVARAMAEVRAEDAARAYLHEYVDAPSDVPRGCLLVQGALACSAESADVQSAIADLRRLAEQLIVARMQRAHKEGDLPPDAKPVDLARYLTTVAQGLAVQATAGVSSAQLRRIAELAMGAWPKT
jgi:AcrR family transcriptional regulator